MLHVPPPSADDKDRELIEELPNGIIHLHLWPKKTTTMQLAWEAPITVFDNSEDRIRHAVKSKGTQVRSSDAPVLLAIQASSISNEFEDFDRALCGRGYDRFDERRRFVGTDFAPDGIFNEKRDKIPTFAGVLAFLSVGFNACTAPVLYRHPHRCKGSHGHVCGDALAGSARPMAEGPPSHRGPAPRASPPWAA
jgi:hypothetical protein